MRVGVDGACWSNRRGYGRFAREIVAAMVEKAPEVGFVCFVDEAAARAFPLEAPNVTTVRVAQRSSPTSAASAKGSRSMADMWRFYRAVAAADVDVFFSPSVYTFFPLPPGLPAVVTIHDAIADRYPELTLPSARARWFWRTKVRLALLQARTVLTVSEFARRDVADFHGLDPSRLRVAIEAPAAAYVPCADPEAVRAVARAAGVPEEHPWIVYVGGFNPHKNVDVLVRAHGRIVAESAGHHPPHLVLVGALGDSFHGNVSQIRHAVTSAGTEELVHWPGFMPDEQLSRLLTGAVALALVSEVEGFGLPAVEAAACGCPVIATTNSPLPELLEGGGFFVEPGDEGAVVNALRTLLSDPEARGLMGRLALDRAGALSWERAADSALEALRDAVA